jgi:hypothetical protein
MIEMLQPGQIITYCVREYPTDGNLYAGTAPIERIVRHPEKFRCHYVVRHMGAEIDVYLDEVAK